MSHERRVDALRRLGGPVCPVCSAVSDIDVRIVDGEHEAPWLAAKGKSGVNREGLAPMCGGCHRQMVAHGVRSRKALHEQLARDAARQWEPNSQEYRDAYAEYADDVEAAEKIAAEWGLGNSILDRGRWGE